MSVHRWPIRVYWEDTDAGGVVYHSNYLTFAERARTEFVRSLGVSQSALADGGQGFAFVVSRIEVDFKKSAKLDDLLMVETRLIAAGGASLKFDQRIIRQTDEVLLTHLLVKVGFVGLDGGYVSRIPQEFRDQINTYLNDHG